MKILSIGNSFSQDSHRYLHKLALQEGVDLQTYNLCIGGCSLRTHYINILDDKEAYFFEFNGQSTAIKLSLRQALESIDFDVVTLQQASHFSSKPQTYSPYIEELASYVRTYCPHAKLYVHETWAYEDGSDRLKNVAGYEKAKDMLSDMQDEANNIDSDYFDEAFETLYDIVKDINPTNDSDSDNYEYVFEADW
jgi:hypothetical protein